MPETTIGQRFALLIQELGLSKNAFAQSLERTATVIQHLVDERNKPGYDLLCSVFEVYPNVSKDWLLVGKGPMLLEAIADRPATTPAPTPVMDTIDLASVAGTGRRRTSTANASLQPAEVAATVALAAQASQPVKRFAPPSEPELTLTATSTAPSPAALPPAATPSAPLVPDPAYLAALLQAQHVQHQLALAEQRNQHLLEQQQMLQQMVQILQKNN